LIRGLGVWAATAIVIGAMIGQSVFLVASDMSSEVGSMTKVLLVWLVGGVVVLFGAFCFAELRAAMPEAGGDYIYLSCGIGPKWEFLFGGNSRQPQSTVGDILMCARVRYRRYGALFLRRIGWGYPFLVDAVEL
jgi:amino acid transporter